MLEARDTPTEVLDKPGPLWHNRDYAGYWLSSLVSALGSAMSQLAYPLLMLYATGSVARAGIVGACLNIGGLSTGLIGGALADRYSRRALIVSADLLQAVAVTTVVVAVADGYVNVLHIGAVALVQGMANGISGAAMGPALRRIVRADQFPTLAASKQGRDMIARLVGPPLGGALFSLLRWLPFLGDAVSFLFSAVGIAIVRQPLGPDLDDDAKDRSTLAGMREGLVYIRGQAFLRFMIVWIAVVSALFGGMVLLVIALIKLRGGGPTTVGVITATAAVGGVCGALLAPLLARRVSTRVQVVACAWATVGLAVGLAVAPAPWQLGVIGALVVMLVVPLNVALETYQLRIVPDAVLGRVTAAFTFGSSCLLWTAPVIAGLLADDFGTPTAMVVLAGAFAAAALWATFSGALRSTRDGGPIG